MAIPFNQYCFDFYTLAKLCKGFEDDFTCVKDSKGTVNDEVTYYTMLYNLMYATAIKRRKPTL